MALARPASLHLQSRALFSEVTFEVEADTTDDASLYVCGDVPMLGSWDTKKAIKLERQSNNEHSQLWASTILLPTEVRAEYKYLKMTDIDDANPQWEETPVNRFTIPTGEAIFLHDGRFGGVRVSEYVLHGDSESCSVVTEEHTPHTNRSTIEDSGPPPVIICHDLLPLKLKSGGATLEFDWDYSYLPGHLRCLRVKYNVCWIGMLPVEVPDDKREIVAKQLKEQFQCIPVFLPKDISEGSVKYCFSVLRPLLHHIINTKEHTSQDLFQAYTEMNQGVAAAVAHEVRPNHTVLVIGYPLFVLPALLRRRFAIQGTTGVSIVFYLPSVFPSSEAFAEYAFREEILRGVLAADAIGFVLFDFARHFLHCASRLLGIQHQATHSGILGVMYEGRHVAGGDFHLRTEEFRRRFLGGISAKGRRIVVAYDELDQLAGVFLKLLGWEKFLEQSEVWRKKITLVQYLYHPNQRKEVDATHLNQLMTKAAEINEIYKDSVILKFEGLNETDRAALFAAADVLLETSIRQGQDLIQMEAVLCSSQRYPAVIVSEFSAVSRLFGGALRIHPWNPLDVQQKLDLALMLPSETRQKYHNLIYDFVKDNSAVVWFKELLAEVAQSTQKTDITAMGHVLAEGVHTLRLLHRDDLLDIPKVAKMYKHSVNRLVILDDSAAVASSRNFLQSMCSDERNSVYVISSGTREKLKQRFQGITNLGLAAEDGFFFQPPGRIEWQSIEDVFISEIGKKLTVQNLRKVVWNIMQLYAERTNGSYIEKRETAFVWHYSKCDREWGAMQAKSLVAHLREVLQTVPMTVVAGNYWVTVRPQAANKGVRTESLLNDTIKKRGALDFLLCLGDDRSDEDTFSFVRRYAESNRLDAVTCTIGRKPSHARYYLDDVKEVQKLLHRLSDESTRANRHMSTSNLQRFENTEEIPPFLRRFSFKLAEPDPRHEIFEESGAEDDSNVSTPVPTSPVLNRNNISQ